MHKSNLEGQRFGKLVVQEYAGNDSNGRTLWKCLCDCGNEKTVSAKRLRSGAVKSCGCLIHNPQFVDLVGKRFGRLVVEKMQSRKAGIVKWECICDCGKRTVVDSHCLVRGQTRSCGCLKREIASDRFRNTDSKNENNGNFKHGMSHKPLHLIWSSMRQRCNNPKSDAFKNYGGRGISVCKEWDESFVQFCKWALDNGYSCGLTIDRINNDGNYEPSNCRWVDRKAQNNNTRRTIRLTVFGKSGSCAEIARLYNVPYEKLRYFASKEGDVERFLREGGYLQDVTDD